MTQNFLNEFGIFADEKLTREINANDVFNLIEQNNELNLYITLKDELDAFHKYKRLMEINGPYPVVFFDIVRVEQGKYYRDFNLVENIEVNTRLKTKPIIDNAISNLSKGMYVYELIHTIQDFSFKNKSFNKYILTPIKKVFKKINSGLLTNSVYSRNILQAEENGTIEIPLDSSVNNVSLIKFLLTDKIKYVSKALKENAIVKQSLINRVLYCDGLFGISDLNLLSYSKPSLYDIQEILGSTDISQNSSYYISQRKHELIIRWGAWLQNPRNSYKLDIDSSIYKKENHTFDIATVQIGLGLYDNKFRYQLLEERLKETGDSSGEVYYIYNPDYSTQIKASTLITAMTENKGDMKLENGKYKNVYNNGIGNESLFFTSLNFFLKETNKNLDFIYMTFEKEFSTLSLEILKSLISPSFETRSKNITEFYDREHISPFESIHSYAPIPLNFANYSLEDCMFCLKEESKSILSLKSSYKILKRKRKEDENGNVVIEDLPAINLRAGDFKIPINKDEYVYKAFIPGGIKTFLSNDLIFHLKITFKKTVQYNQNLMFRLFTDNLTFVDYIYVKDENIAAR